MCTCRHYAFLHTFSANSKKVNKTKTISNKSCRVTWNTFYAQMDRKTLIAKWFFSCMSGMLHKAKWFLTHTCAHSHTAAQLSGTAPTPQKQKACFHYLALCCIKIWLRKQFYIQGTEKILRAYAMKMTRGVVEVQHHSLLTLALAALPPLKFKTRFVPPPPPPTGWVIWRSHTTAGFKPHTILPVTQSLYSFCCPSAAAQGLFDAVRIPAVCLSTRTYRILLHGLGTRAVTVMSVGMTECRVIILSHNCLATS
jgi:hypothetical protein